MCDSQSSESRRISLATIMDLAFSSAAGKETGG